MKKGVDFIDFMRYNKIGKTKDKDVEIRGIHKDECNRHK